MRSGQASECQMSADCVRDTTVEYQPPVVELGERELITLVGFGDKTAALPRELTTGDHERRSGEPSDGDASLSLRAREDGLRSRAHAEREGAVRRLAVERAVRKLNFGMRTLDLC